MVAAQPPTGRVLLLSDIHFDSLADQKIISDLASQDISRWERIITSSKSFKKDAYPRRGKNDSNYTLLHSALLAAAHEEPFDFVIVLGDYLRHDFVNEFVKKGGSQSELPQFATKTAVFVINTIQATFNVPVYFALGNEDSACNDYGVTPDGAFLKALAGSIRTMKNNPGATADFCEAGFYEVAHPIVPDQEIIVLNTVLWSPKYFNCRGDGNDPGAREMKWLSSKLYEAKMSAKTVMLVMHIPPGLDAYQCAKDADSKKITTMWKDIYLRQFLGMMGNYGDIVRIALAGHTHMDDFRVLNTTPSSRSVALKITPAITPIFGNNPAFSILHYRPSAGEVFNTTTYNFDLSGSGRTWRREYSFPTAYGYKTLTPVNLTAVAAAIQDDPKVRQRFARYYAASAPSPLTPDKWRFYSCAETKLTAAEYSRCIENAR